MSSKNIQMTSKDGVDLLYPRTTMENVVGLNGKVLNLENGAKQVGNQVNDIKLYLNYMPIEGGTFDGNDTAGLIIDGGKY